VKARLEKYWRENSITILPHKQACHAGRVSLVDSERESPLGPVKLVVRGSRERLKKTIEYLVK